MSCIKASRHRNANEDIPHVCHCTMQKFSGMGPGPVLGGSAGGQDYSLSSMLERAPYRTKDDHGTHITQLGLISISALLNGLTRLVWEQQSFLRGAWSCPELLSCLLSRVFVVLAVEGMPELNSKLSAGEQDLLAGSGTVEGEDGQKPPFNIRCCITCAALSTTFVLCLACGQIPKGSHASHRPPCSVLVKTEWRSAPPS